MANQIPTAVVIADKMLEYMDGFSTILQHVNRKYETAFKADPATWGFGQTINVKKPPRYTSQDGPVITNVQDINIGTIPVSINKWRNVAIQLGGFELSFNARQFDTWAEENLKPIVSPLIADIEVDIFQLYKKIYNHVGTPGTGFGTTPLAAFDLLASAREKMTMVGNTPQEDRVCFLNPHAARIFGGAIAAGYNPAGAIGGTLQSGKPYRTAGFDIFEANSVASHLTGTMAMTGTVLVNSGLPQTGNTLTLTVSSGQTFTPGDVFVIPGVGGTIAAPVAGVFSVNPTTKQSTNILQDFVVVSSSTSSTTATVVVDPPIIPSGAFQNVTTAPAINSVVIPVNKIAQAAASFINNICFWKDALGLVSVPIKAPDQLKATTRSYKNLSITLTTGSDIKDYAQIWRADVVYGTVCYYPENCCRLPN